MNIFNDETIIYYKSHGSPMEEGMMCEIFGVTYKNDKILHVIQLILYFCKKFALFYKRKCDECKIKIHV